MIKQEAFINERSTSIKICIKYAHLKCETSICETGSTRCSIRRPGVANTTRAVFSWRRSAFTSWLPHKSAVWMPNASNFLNSYGKGNISWLYNTIVNIHNITYNGRSCTLTTALTINGSSRADYACPKICPTQCPNQSAFFDSR